MKLVVPVNERSAIRVRRYVGTQDGIKRFYRSRNAISGLDEYGKYLCPGWADPAVISLAHGEGTRRPHPSVVAAGVKAMLDVKESSLDNYLYLRHFDQLTSAITQSFVKDGIPEQVAGNVCVDSGNTRLFYGFFFAVSDLEDVFLVPKGYYQAVNMWADIAGVQLECVNTSKENDYKFTRSDLEAWFDERARTGACKAPRGLLLFNPSYMGAVYTAEELEDIAQFVAQHDLVVLEDAIFTGTEFYAPTVHLASIDGMQSRVVTIDGGSKAYGLANIRIGWGCGPAEIIERMNYFTMANSITVPHAAKAMALAALEAPIEYLQQNLDECRTRAHLVSQLVDDTNEAVSSILGFSPRKPFFEVAHAPRAGHSILLSAEGMAGLNTPSGTTIADSVDVTRYFLSERQVCFSPGLSNGFTDCTVRVTFGCLGSEHTWNSARLAELGSSLNTVLSEFNDEDEHGMQTLRRTLDSDIAAMTVEDHAAREAGFAAGRATMISAFRDRVIPAAETLALENKTALSVDASSK